MSDLDRPQFWQLKGEGNANWVFNYTGTRADLLGQVLRVRKPKPVPAAEELALEDAVWAPVLGAANLADAASAAAAREQAYVELLLAPLLGQQHIPQQQAVQPTPGFVKSLLLHTRCADAALASAADSLGVASLMPDVTLLPVRQQEAASSMVAAGRSEMSGGLSPGPVVCVELKPKCGFIASCGSVHPANRAVKFSRSRFQLHQMLKLAEGKVSAVSSYDPCDLFSGDPARLRVALSALLDQPHNNLLLFVDGARQRMLGQQESCKGQQKPSGEASKAGAQQQLPAGQQQQQLDSTQQQPMQTLEEQLAALLPPPVSDRRGALVELLAAVLEQERVLPRLLEAQQQCRWDIEGIHRLYCHLAGTAVGGSKHGQLREDADSSGNAAPEQPADDEHVTATQQLLSLPLSEAFAVLRAYVVAATAKDCAIMIALQRLEAPPEKRTVAAAETSGRSSEGQQQQAARRGQGREKAVPAVRHVFYAAAGAWYAYSLYFVDLDQKPLAKIPKHHELDAAIMAAARRHLANGREGVLAAAGGNCYGGTMDGASARVTSKQ